MHWTHRPRLLNHNQQYSYPMNDIAWQFISGIAILAIIFMLVRPGAPAAAAIEDTSKALSGLVKTATSYSVVTIGQTQ
jgi:hypothetical protein